ncbi:MAG TPA: carbohydrate ABC transporter permease, partial [Clostridiales bacterium]|nr:carbohydrate ABC transporter permease [Clostridiales bacterium]
MVNHSSRINKIRISKSDKVFDIVNTTLAIIGLIIVLYPLMHIVACSFSSGRAVQSGRVTFYPVDFTLQAYVVVFDYKDIWTGYLNTIFYTVVGTILN